MRALSVALFALVMALPAAAQELSVNGGTTAVAGTTDSSYGWSIDYRQSLAKHFAFSVSWINEGHLTDHHRDGPAAQLWLRNSFGKRFGLEFGYGAYRWFDTARTGTGSVDLHGTGSILSGAATWNASERWFLRLAASRMRTTGSVDTSQILFGAGYRLWVPHDGTPPQSATPPPQFTRATADELMLFAGRSIRNNFQSEATRAIGLEFRHGLAKYVDWTASLFDEGNGSLRRNSLASQLWLVRAYAARRVEVGLGAGIFYRLDGRASQTTSERIHDYDGLVTATLAWRFGTNALTRLNWNRIATSNSRDKDVIVLGLGFQWGVPG